MRKTLYFILSAVVVIVILMALHAHWNSDRMLFKRFVLSTMPKSLSNLSIESTGGREWNVRANFNMEAAEFPVLKSSRPYELVTTELDTSFVGIYAQTREQSWPRVDDLGTFSAYNDTTTESEVRYFLTDSTRTQYYFFACGL